MTYVRTVAVNNLYKVEHTLVELNCVPLSTPAGHASLLNSRLGTSDDSLLILSDVGIARVYFLCKAYRDRKYNYRELRTLRISAY